MSETLDVVASIGIAGWVAFSITLFGAVAMLEDAYRNWSIKSGDAHWRRITLMRTAAVIAGALFSVCVGGVANLKASHLRQQLAETQRAVSEAQAQLDDDRAKIVKLNKTTGDLRAQSNGALDEAKSANAEARRISGEVIRLNGDTRRRLLKTDTLAKASALQAEASQRFAQHSAVSARASEIAARQSASNAAESRTEAVAAAVHAHVYRLPDHTIAKIESIMADSSKTTTVFIACSSGLEDVCRQLGTAFRAAGIDPTVRPGASFFTAGFDAKPLARTDNPNVTVSYMSAFEKVGRGISEALSSAGLRVGVEAFASHTLAPNLEINFDYVGTPP